MRTAHCLLMPRASTASILIAVLLAAPLLPGAAAEDAQSSEPPLVLEGVILSETGDPLAGAAVTAYTYQEDGARWKDHTRTGDDGVYRLRLGPGVGILEVQREKYQPQTLDLNLTDNQTLNVTLEPLPPPPERTAHIAGVVTDEAGVPVEGARVYLYPSYRHHHGMPEPAVEEVAASDGGGDAGTDTAEAGVAKSEARLIAPYPYDDDHHATTGQDGRFEFVAYPGMKELRVEAHRYAYHHETFEATEGNTTMAIELEKVPDATATLEGRVLDAETGEPVPGAWVNAEHLGWSRGQSATTDEDGRFTIKTMPGRVQLRASAWSSGYGVTDVMPDIDPAGVEIAIPERMQGPERAYYTWQATLQATDGANDLEIELTPKPTPTIPVTGWVIDQDTEKAIPNAWVTIRNEDTGDWGRAQADEDGSFRLLVRPGYHVIEAGADGFLGYTEVLDVRAAPGLLALPLEKGERKWAPCWDECYHTMHTDPAVLRKGVTEEAGAPTGIGGDDAMDADRANLMQQGGTQSSDDGGDGSTEAQAYQGEGGGLGTYSADRAGEPAPTTEGPADDEIAAVPAPGLALLGIAVTAGAAFVLRRRQIR